jgi:predicted metal-dependent phosphoesterase TrpH
MGKADLHIHSTYSYDSSNTVSAILDWASRATDLDVIAITDHDEIEGALEARERAEAFGIEVIPGIEVTTAQGHLLALFVERKIAAGLSFLDTVLQVAEQGGICIAAHPYAILAHGVTGEIVCGVLENPIAAQTLVGIEAINTGLFFQSSNERARQLVEEVGLAPVGSSDSHLFWSIGFGYTEFEGHTAADVRTALLSHQTRAYQLIQRHSPGYYLSHVFYRTLRKLGWVTWSPEPNSALVLRRLSQIEA